MRNIKFLCLLMLISSFLSGCSTSILIPPLPGPTMIPSSIGTLYNAYAISTDERGFQTIIEDEMLETKIQHAILNEKGLEILDISTYAYNGHVYVIGKYDEKEDFQRIRQIVKNTKEANSLTTYLFAEKEEEQCSASDDYLLQMSVKTALLNDDSVWGANVAVKSVQCNIILLGRVGDFNEAVAAKQITARVNGVKSVKTFIRSSRQNKYLRQNKRIAAVMN
ncbi:BON domain-containing protein [Maridesulfovibrio hydrothermalis]|uniref:Transport-associated protein n=1 Tax=Maridesulfovibrio hydrothermalis AM13 = DSM 14728 TaxID=1121451 RepID=L0RIF4_9BACT|nr:BON domain-containing protein [Maridesulfovibrio hydrothermalis]CCO25381.1 Transport-associated protein [Maridesulfovibrio hydrothermalis AM13 = DSM 14728]